ncbi:MAG TPA: protein-disulfide reductase DsbD domain-containing protein [Steroidobacteraceae bacterium]|nr:protein-disulfide reductase DsbD domain-containing protein [Steroidobacteraceae bacterium]
MIRVMSMRHALSALLAVALFAGVGKLGATEPAASDSVPANAAQSDTVQWRVQVLPAHARPGDTAELVFTAEIAPGWILYSSDFSAEIGPRPARFTLDPTPGLAPIEGVRAVHSLRRKDKTLKTEYAYFERHAEFRQKVKLTAPVTTITGRINGQTCFEQSGLCQLFQKTFTATLD